MEEGTSLITPRHRLKKLCQHLAPSVGTTWSFLLKIVMVVGDQGHPCPRKEKCNRSGFECYGPELKSDRSALMDNVSVGTRPSVAFRWQSCLCVRTR
jgi:hypothetical protein